MIKQFFLAMTYTFYYCFDFTSCQVSVNGRISSAKHGNNRNFNLRKMEHDLILILNANFDLSKGEKVQYVEQNDALTLKRASSDVSNFIWRNFTASQVFIVSYENLEAYNRNYDFQGVLVTDGSETYLIHIIKHYLGSTPIQSGVSAKNCFWNWFGGTEWSTGVRSNTGYFGMNIFKVSSEKCFHQCKCFIIFTKKNLIKETI